MAMLAEKKKRVKWPLNPRGKSWSDDQNKFGQKILEKMGWSAGQGLGANNQGPTEIVKVKKKDDNKGLGFKENGEEWLKTSTEFNELLDKLKSNDKITSEEVQKETIISLENRSKNSKARVHYQKFTRGKDLSQYSDKDLASIIGPDVVKQPSAASDDYTNNQVNRGSSEDYFSSKKKHKKESKFQNNEYNDFSEEVNSCENYTESYLKVKKNKKSEKLKKEDEKFIAGVEGPNYKTEKSEETFSNDMLTSVEVSSELVSIKQKKRKTLTTDSYPINQTAEEFKEKSEIPSKIKKIKISHCTDTLFDGLAMEKNKSISGVSIVCDKEQSEENEIKSQKKSKKNKKNKELLDGIISNELNNLSCDSQSIEEESVLSASKKTKDHSKKVKISKFGVMSDDVQSASKISSCEENSSSVKESGEPKRESKSSKIKKVSDKNSSSLIDETNYKQKKLLKEVKAKKKEKLNKKVDFENTAEEPIKSPKSKRKLKKSKIKAEDCV